MKPFRNKMYPKKILGSLSIVLLLFAMISCNETNSDNDGHSEHAEHSHNGMDDDHVDKKKDK